MCAVRIVMEQVLALRHHKVNWMIAQRNEGWTELGNSDNSSSSSNNNNNSPDMLQIGKII